MTIFDRIAQAAGRRGLYLGRRSTRPHVWIYRWTRGRLGSQVPGYPAVHMVLVDHVGARSGVRRTSPLLSFEEHGAVVVAASKAGQPTNPAWLSNLRAHPDTTVQVRAEVRAVRARVADDAERERLWSRFIELYPPFEFYAQLAGRRTIPIVLLEPRAADTGAGGW